MPHYEHMTFSLSDLEFRVHGVELHNVSYEGDKIFLASPKNQNQHSESHTMSTTCVYLTLYKHHVVCTYLGGLIL